MQIDAPTGLSHQQPSYLSKKHLSGSCPTKGSGMWPHPKGINHTHQTGWNIHPRRPDVSPRMATPQKKHRRTFMYKKPFLRCHVHTCSRKDQEPTIASGINWRGYLVKNGDPYLDPHQGFSIICVLCNYATIWQERRCLSQKSHDLGRGAIRTARTYCNDRKDSGKNM